MITYVYHGDGLGVPGLPHRITEAEAEQIGQADLLAAAIAAGIYLPEETPAQKEQE